MKLHQAKVNGGNGRNGHGGQLASELNELLDELAVVEHQRAAALRLLGEKRREVYRRAARHGVTGRVLKAAHALRNST
jgi:hypothetical protein